jgi:hypothetical protein
MPKTRPRKIVTGRDWLTATLAYEPETGSLWLYCRSRPELAIGSLEKQWHLRAAPNNGNPENNPFLMHRAVI